MCGFGFAFPLNSFKAIFFTHQTSGGLYASGIFAFIALEFLRHRIGDDLYQ
jgi:hypothetical protein